MNEDLETIIREVYSSYDVRYGNAIVDLKQRIDKTIEYIDNNYYDFTYTYTKNEELKSNQLETIKDILKGSDKEWIQ